MSKDNLKELIILKKSGYLASANRERSEKCRVLIKRRNIAKKLNNGEVDCGGIIIPK